jgi:hypothetical protein
MKWQTFDGNKRPKSEEPMLLKMPDGNVIFGFYYENFNSWRDGEGDFIPFAQWPKQFVYLKDLVAELEST